MCTLTSTVVVVHILLKNCRYYCTLIMVNHTNTGTYVYCTLRMYVCTYVSKENVVLQQ